jgi:hypothetical protein
MFSAVLRCVGPDQEIGGFTVVVLGLPCCFIQGDAIDECLNRAQEAGATDQAAETGKVCERRETTQISRSMWSTSEIPFRPGHRAEAAHVGETGIENRQFAPVRAQDGREQTDGTMQASGRGTARSVARDSSQVRTGTPTA